MIYIARYIDRYFIWWIIILLSWIKKSPCEHKAREILFIRLWWMGSAILTLPTLVDLQKEYPESKITILSTRNTQHVFKNTALSKHIDQINLFSCLWVWKIMTYYKKYDLVIDTEEYFQLTSLISLWTGKKTIGFSTVYPRSLWYSNPVEYDDGIHVVNVFHSLLGEVSLKLGKKVVLRLIPLKTSVTDEEYINSFLRESAWENSSLIGIHLGGSKTSTDRFWPVQSFAEMIELVTQKTENTLFVVTGTQRERVLYEMLLMELPKNIHKKIIFFNGSDFPFTTLARMMTKMKVFVSNDTWPMHLSASMGCYTVGLFWPNLPVRFAPYPPNENKSFYHGNGIASINVHKGIFSEDENWWIKKITPKEVAFSILERL